jgi:hypothetical protein
MSSSLPEECRVCGADSPYVFTLPVLGNPVRYFDCKACGYVQTAAPYWLDRAYASAINDVDTGIMMRNRLNVGRVVMTLVAIGKLDGRVVDHAGGYGILVRMLRDAGVEAKWRDKYCDNLLARGFEAADETCDLLTAFEVFEHLEHPLGELKQMLDQSATVLLSTELVPGPQTPSPQWWYFGPEHGQHIGFFRPATLQWMADKVKCHHASDGVSVHIFSKEPIPRRWNTLLNLRRLAPLATRLRLRSKTVSDFESLRDGRR